MDLTRLDATILVVYAIFVVIGGFMFPALGLAGSEQTSSDVPEFNMNQTRFDFVDDLPEYPSEPTSGVLNHTSDKFDDYRGQTQVELGPDSGGNDTFLSAVPEERVNLISSGDNVDNHTFTSNGEIDTLTGRGWTIDVHAVDIDKGEYEFVVTESPNDSDIPLIGGVIDLADGVASGLFWIASTFVVISMIIVEGAANLGGIMFDVVTYFIDLGGWAVGFVNVIIGGAPGYAKVIVTVIMTPLFYVFAKSGIIVINMVNPFG